MKKNLRPTKVKFGDKEIEVENIEIEVDKLDASWAYGPTSNTFLGSLTIDPNLYFASGTSGPTTSGSFDWIEYEDTSILRNVVDLMRRMYVAGLFDGAEADEFRNEMLVLDGTLNGDLDGERQTVEALKRLVMALQGTEPIASIVR